MGRAPQSGSSNSASDRRQRLRRRRLEVHQSMQIEQIVRGRPDGSRSQWRISQWSAITSAAAGRSERILEHIQRYPDGIGGRYMRGRPSARRKSIGAPANIRSRELPLSGNGAWTGWEASHPPEPGAGAEGAARDDPEQELDDDLEDDEHDEEPPRSTIPSCHHSIHTVTLIRGRSRRG